MSGATKALKTLRASQPFNYIATALVHWCFSAAGVQSETVIKHLHRVGGVARKLPNGRTLKLWSLGDDWISNQIFWRGWCGYEPESSELFFRLASCARVTVDVGAYVGYYTLIAAHANPSGRVYAFEPLAEIHDRLTRNVELNGLKNVVTLASAVGDVDGSAEFFHVATPLPSSSSLSFEFMRPTAGLTSSTVPVTTLDRFLRGRGIGRVDLVKIDTESTEPQVLRGMAETLDRDRPTILCEVLKGQGSETALEEILGPLGYRYYLLTPDGPVAQSHVEGHSCWFNYLFTTMDVADVI